MSVDSPLRHSATDPDDSTVMVLQHDGYSYETTWTTAAEWTPWTCSEPGCRGKVATAASQASKLRPDRGMVISSFGDRRMKIVMRRPHNHPPRASAGPSSPPLGNVSKLLNIIKKSSDSKTNNTPSTCNENIDAIAVCHSIIQVAKIPEKSLNIDCGLKNNLEKKELAPIDFNYSESKKRHLKEITTCDAIDSKYVDEIKKESLDIKTSLKKSIQKAENEKLKCLVCCEHFSLCNFDQHIKTIEHKTATEKLYKDRIDFKNNLIFSSFICTSISTFLINIEKDFTILVNHILLGAEEDELLLINVKLVTLYHKDSIDEENKNIAEVKHFDVPNLKITKETDIHKLYKDIMDSFVIQSDDLKSSGWTLEEILYVEINKLEPLSNNVIEPVPLNEFENEPQTTDNDNKTVIKLLQCNTCCEYIFRKDYPQHLESISHKIMLHYFQNENVQIIKSQRNGYIAACRITFPKHDTLDNFLNSIQSIVLEVVEFIIKLHNLRCIHTNIQLCAVYNDKSHVYTEKDCLGRVNSFEINNEMLFGNTFLLDWYQKVLNTFKSYNSNFLKTLSTYYLNRVLFFELQFYELIDISD